MRASVCVSICKYMLFEAAHTLLYAFDVSLAGWSKCVLSTRQNNAAGPIVRSTRYIHVTLLLHSSMVSSEAKTRVQNLIDQSVCFHVA